MPRHRAHRSSPRAALRADAKRVLALAWLALALVVWAPPAAATQSVEGGEVDVSWEPATGPVSHYRLWVSEDGGSFVPHDGDAIAGTQTTFTGRAGVRYRLAVTAHDDAGRTGPPSPASEDFVFADGAPGAGADDPERRAARDAAATLLLSLAPPPEAQPEAAASAVMAPYAVHGSDEVTRIQVALESGPPGLLQVHLLNHTPIGGAAPGASPTDSVFSFTCPIEPDAPASIVIVHHEDGQAGVHARCAESGGDRHLELATPPGLAVSGYALIGLLDPDLPTRSRIADRLRASWTQLHFGQGRAHSGPAWPMPSGSDGDAAPGADDFEFRLDGGELATLRFEPELPDRDSDGIRDFVDSCPDVPDQDDGLDADGDTVPDACDRCPAADDVTLLGTGLTNLPSAETDTWGAPLWCSACAPEDATDTDGDGHADACDRCPGFDDLVDADGDGFPDACDLCPAGDDALDADGDGVPDACDQCPGSDDAVDADADGIPDGCACPCFDLEDALALEPVSCSWGGGALAGLRGSAIGFASYCSYRSGYTNLTVPGPTPRHEACAGVLRTAAEQAGLVCR